MRDLKERPIRAQEFALRAGVTVRTLHHYDRMGLLRPSRYTAAGHRLYGSGDLARLQQIVTLKFIGLPLRRIKELLENRDFDLRATLRLQRKIMEERRHHLEMALKAITEAEGTLVPGGEPDWDAFRNIIEVINMQNDMEWMKKYYTEEQLAELARRGTPEVLEKGQRDWAALIKDVQEAVARGLDPASEEARGLAERWQDLIEQFTGGDPGIAESLRKLYADQSNWPSSFQKPFPDEAGEFIAKARQREKKE